MGQKLSNTKKRETKLFNKKVGRSFDEVIEEVPTEILLEIGQKICPIENAVHFYNKKDTFFYQNVNELKRSLRRTYQIGAFNHRQRAHEILLNYLEININEEVAMKPDNNIKTWLELASEHESEIEFLFEKTVQSLFEKSLQKVGKTILEQYDELVDAAIELISENTNFSNLEKRLSYLKLLDIETVEEMYEYAAELEEDESDDFGYTSFSSHDGTYEYRNDIQISYLEKIEGRWLDEMINSLKEKPLSFYSHFESDFKEKEVRNFLEERFDDLYEELANNIDSFDSLHFEIPYTYRDFHKFTVYFNKVKALIDKKVHLLDKQLEHYHKEAEAIKKELEIQPTIKRDLKENIFNRVIQQAKNELELIIDLSEKNSKSPAKTQRLLESMKDFDTELWKFKATTETLSLVFNKTKLRDGLHTAYAYEDYFNDRNRINHLEDEEYEALMEELIDEDLLNLNEYETELKNLTIFEIEKMNNSTPIVKEIHLLLSRYSIFLETLREREGKWIKNVLGPSVFETYKKNNPNKIIIHVGATNTGKTFAALSKLKRSDSGLYLAPLRLLALEVYETLNSDGVACSLKTGEEEKNIEFATHTSSTVEMCRIDKDYEIAVIDECQMIADEERGSAWARAILGVKAKELHLITAPEGLSVLEKILEGKNIEIKHYERKTELELISQRLNLKSVEKGDAVIVFSRIKALITAKQLENRGFKPAIIYGSMPPSVRQKQVNYFHKGEFDVVVATDAIGMGMNLPIKRVVFAESYKFDGKSRRLLNTSELKQIGGRAGRQGMFDVGFVGFMDNESHMKTKFLAKTKEITEIVISPTFEMYCRFYEQMGMTCEIQAMKTFINYWRTYKPNESFVKVNSMKNQLALINHMNHYENKGLMSLEDVWRFVHIPLNLKEESLLDLWRQNVKSLVLEKKSFELEVKNPRLIKELEELELEYKKIDVQLAFYEDGDVRFRHYEPLKEEITEKIFVILKRNIQKLTKKCKFCKSRLPLTYEHAMCQSCYQSRYINNRYDRDYYW